MHLRRPRALGLLALLLLAAGCLTDEGGSPGTAGEDPDAVDQMDQDPRQESVQAPDPTGDGPDAPDAVPT